MYRFVSGISAQEHDAFVKTTTKCNLLQSAAWGKIKANWKHEIIGVYDGEQLVASALALIKPLPLTLSMIYLPRGPIMDFTNKELVTFFFENTRKWAKKHHCLFVKCDPSIYHRYSFVDEEASVPAEYEECVKNFCDAGLNYHGLTPSMDDTIQPRFHMAVTSDAYSIENFSKKGKKNYKIALKKHFDTIVCHKDGLKDFTTCMQATSERKNISLRDEEYYRLLLDVYQDDAYLVLTYLDIQKTYDEACAKLAQVEKDLETCPENAKKKRFTLEENKVSYEREVNEFKQYLSEYGPKAVVCGTLSVCYGNTCEILYAGMDQSFKRYMGPYLTWSKTMEHSFSKGCTFTNMGGVENTLKGGLSDFKSIFHPVVVEYAGEFDLPVNRILYALSQYAYQLRKKRK